MCYATPILLKNIDFLLPRIDALFAYNAKAAIRALSIGVAAQITDDPEWELFSSFFTNPVFIKAHLEMYCNDRKIMHNARKLGWTVQYYIANITRFDSSDDPISAMYSLTVCDRCDIHEQTTGREDLCAIAGAWREESIGNDNLVSIQPFGGADISMDSI